MTTEQHPSSAAADPQAKPQRKAAARRQEAASPKKSAAKAQRATASPRRAASKQDRLLALLHRPSGATVAACMKASGWQAHSVRGFFAGMVRKKLKLNLVSDVVDGKRVYRIAASRRKSKG